MQRRSGLTFLVDFEASFWLAFTFLELLLLRCRSSLWPYAVAVGRVGRRRITSRSQEGQLWVLKVAVSFDEVPDWIVRRRERTFGRHRGWHA